MPSETGVLAEIRFRARRSPWKMCRWIADRLFDSHSDRRFGIVSSERKGAADLALPSPDFVHYQAVSYSDMRELLAHLTVEPSDVFLDYGAGMGRAVCLAASYRFRAVLGVEISPELCQIARRNIALVLPKLTCQDVRIVQADALQYAVPSEVSVVFFFNPFGGAALSRVLDNLADSVRNSPRKLQVIFYGTVSGERFRKEAAARAWLTLESESILATGALVLRYGGLLTKL